jgi:hypothetical protein
MEEACSNSRADLPNRTPAERLNEQSFVPCAALRGRPVEMRVFPVTHNESDDDLPAHEKNNGRSMKSRANYAAQQQEVAHLLVVATSISTGYSRGTGDSGRVPGFGPPLTTVKLRHAFVAFRDYDVTGSHNTPPHVGLSLRVVDEPFILDVMTH